MSAANRRPESPVAAIIALAFTIGSWVLDFALAGQPGVLDWIARLSLTQTLRGMATRRFQVAGHTDNEQITPETKKKYPTNWELSTERCEQH